MDTGIRAASVAGLLAVLAVLAVLAGCGAKDSGAGASATGLAGGAGGAAYVGNSNSMVVHRADCRYVGRMKPENRVGFDRLAPAYDEGYAPCRHCLPGARPSLDTPGGQFLAKANAIRGAGRVLLVAIRDLRQGEAAEVIRAMVVWRGERDVEEWEGILRATDSGGGEIARLTVIGGPVAVRGVCEATGRAPSAAVAEFFRDGQHTIALHAAWIRYVGGEMEDNGPLPALPP